MRQQWYVEYEVRLKGSIGLFRLKGDTVYTREGGTVTDALDKFREKWGGQYETRFPSKCRKVEVSA